MVDTEVKKEEVNATVEEHNTKDEDESSPLKDPTVEECNIEDESKSSPLNKSQSVPPTAEEQNIEEEDESSPLKGSQTVPSSDCCEEQQIRKRTLSNSSKKSCEVTKAKPPDGGWGWMCVLGCFIMHILLGGQHRSFGVIYVQLRERFQSSAALAAFIGGTTTGIRMLASPLATTLADRYGARPVVMAGGLVWAIGVGLCAFATSPYHVLITYAVLSGIGSTMIYAPGLVVIGQWFDKRRARAIGVSTTGSGIGGTLFPLLIAYLLEKYGWFGTFLISAAMYANAIVTGALYRSVPHPIKSTEQKPKKAKPCSQEAQLLMNPMFVFFSLSLAFGAATFVTAQSLIPDMAVSRGITKMKAVVLLSLIGITDTVTRFLIGFFFDLKWIRPIRAHLFALAYLLLGITNFFFALLHDFTWLAIMCCIHGIMNGIVSGQRATVCADVFGVEKLSGSFGLAMALQGASVILAPFGVGYLRDVTGNYMASFMLTFAFGAASYVFFYISFFIGRRRAKLRANTTLELTVKE